MHRYNQRGGGGVGWTAKPSPLHPCVQLTRCFSAVAELLVLICVKMGCVKVVTYFHVNIT